VKQLIKILAVILMAALQSCSVNEQPLTVLHLDSPAGLSAGEPYLFTDPQGKIHMIWIERQDTIAMLKLSHWHNEQWTEPVVVASGSDWFVNWADYPLAVGNSSGKFMAHVLDKSGEGTFAYDVKITTSQDGLTWTTPTVLHDDGKQAEHGFVSMIPFGENVFISWLDGRNTVSDEPEQHDDHGHHGEMTVRAALVTYEGNKLEEWELDSRACDCCQTTAAITDNGPIVIYRDRSENEVRDISIVRLLNNEWTKPEPVFQDNWEISGCPVNGPRCEAKGNTLAVAWFTMADNVPGVSVIFSSDGGATFGKPIRVNENETIGRVDLVLLDEETVLVSWMEAATIKVAKVHSNGEKGQPTTIAESSEARASGFPQMTKAENLVMVAWTDDQERTIKVAKLDL
jgi:hypothetical protein